MYFLYNDKQKKEVKFTLRELSSKVTVINLKTIRMSDFAQGGDTEGADVGDIPDYI
jgi:hypothetical protein